MSFLAPLFFIGTAAIVLPILFHLVRRSTRERQSFSSLMFLRASPPRLSRRSRVEHWLLLLLRSVAVALLALAFARPFMQRQFAPPPSQAEGRRTLVLLDQSASMQRAGFWSDAVERAGRILRETSPLDEVAIYAFAKSLQPILTFDEWRSLSPGQRQATAEQRVRALQPEWSSSYIGQALMTASEIATEPSRGEPIRQARIVLISDVQEGGRIGSLQGYEWPNGVEVEIETVSPQRRSNASLQLIGERLDAGAGSRESPGVWLRVVNEPDSKREEFRVSWSEGGERLLGAPVEVYVPPGQSRTLRLPAVTNANAELVQLTGDEEEFDNHVYVGRPEPVKVGVLYVGEEIGEDSRRPLYYLLRALRDTPRQHVGITVAEASQPGLEDLVKAAHLVVVTTSPGPELETWAEMGKTILFAVRKQASLEGLPGVPSGNAPEEARPEPYAMWAEVDFKHPLFSPFADPRYSDFTRIHFWRYRRLDAGLTQAGRTLARFDTGDPAVLEYVMGKGRVLVLTSGWEPEDGQLALSSKFVPLMYALVEQIGAPPPPPDQHFVGERVDFPEFAGEAEVEIHRGRENFRLAAAGEGFAATTPGLFTAKSAGRERTFAANLDPAESRTLPVSVEEFEMLRAPLSGVGVSPEQRAAAKIRMHRTELESSQKLWRWVIVICLGVLLLETWLAGRTWRLQTQT